MNHISFFKNGRFSLSNNNPYYVEKDNALFSKDMKKIYIIKAEKEVIYEDDVEIMPLAFSGFSSSNVINFYGKVNKIHSYAINSYGTIINFYNDVNNIDERIFTNLANYVVINFNNHAKEYSENSFVEPKHDFDPKYEIYINVNLS